MTRTLGVRGLTGQPRGGEEFKISPLNVIGLTGIHRRKFDSIVNVDTDIDFDAIFGHAETSRQDWYLVNSLIVNAKPYPVCFKFLPYKGTGSAQASLTKNDLQSVQTLKLHSAYKNINSFGEWDNNIAVKIVHTDRIKFKLRIASLVNDTVFNLDSVVGIKLNDVITISTFSMKVTGINETNRQITVSYTGSIPAFAVGTDVKVKGFRIETYIKDHNGLIERRSTNLDNIDMVMESNHDLYFVEILKNHPFVKGENLNSSSVNYDKFPAESTTYEFLSGGADGSNPTTVAHWKTIQPNFENIRMNYFFNTGTFNLDVRADYEEWCRTLDCFPQYWQPTDDYGDNKTLLINDYKRFMRNTGWNQMFNVYGYRYVPNPFGSSPKKISVTGAVLGLRIFAIYSGQANLSISEPRFSLKGFVSGSSPIPEDNLDVWNDKVRTDLYDAGVNLVQYVDGYGVILRNERTPTNNYLVRDSHIHIINQMIKFISLDNLKSQENKPAKYTALNKMAQFLKYNLLIPLYEGNLYPYVIGEGAFRDVNDKDEVASIDEVARIIANRTNNPKNTFELGDANIDIGFIPYSVFRSIYITVFPEER